ncbi:molybdenum cofactor synthesis protein 2b [Ophiostoma piceae UAMH 11346]|uniref:Molybdopterin synthase catalytic subunit n=1 Tax=Ophiostoma piceae (strain UAMH 11346) TaxID=1262450 RepID=S3BRL5_OPHP1|nr:molybdenum cofactor synthesis protein 2b [Ophiostoma piceae UAMH 11346]
MARQPSPKADAPTDACHVALSEEPLDVAAIMQRVRSPKAGANVLFAGSTRDSFDGRAVATLRYAAYQPRALQSMRDIAASIRLKHNLTAIAIVHRLGPVPIGEDSVLIAVSAPHRKAAWTAGEECLERVKERVEIWKQEVFEPTADAAKAEGTKSEEGESVWRANKDATLGMPTVVSSAAQTSPSPSA